MSNKFNEETGKRIQDARCQKGFSRDELSERADISAGFLGAIEKGEKGMSAFTLCNISRALNVTADFILFGSNNIDQRLFYAVHTLASLHEDECEAIRVLLEQAAFILRGMNNIN